MLPSSLLSSSQPCRKKQYLKWLEGSLFKEQLKLPTVPVATRQNSWFNAVKYHSSIVQFYEGFFKQEKSHSFAVDKILELVDDGQLHNASYHNLHLKLHFINENCTCLLTISTGLEETKSQLACVAYNMMEDVKQYLHTGTSKSTFGVDTDHLLSELGERESYLKFPRFVLHIFFKTE